MRNTWGISVRNHTKTQFIDVREILYRKKESIKKVSPTKISKIERGKRTILAEDARFMRT
jgi:hypothetical protein